MGKNLPPEWVFFAGRTLYRAVRIASMTMEKDKCVCFIDGDFITFHLSNINLPCISKVCV